MPWFVLPGLAAALLLLVALGFWAAFAFLLITAFLCVVASLAISIQSTHRGWESPDPRFKRRLDLWLRAGLSSGLRSQAPRWALFVGLMLLGLATGTEGSPVWLLRLMLVAGVVLVVGSFFLAFSAKARP